MVNVAAMKLSSTTVCQIIDSLHSSEIPAIVELTADSLCSHSRHEVFERATRLAGRLRAWGIAPGEVVMVLAENRPEWIIAALAVIRSGAVISPVDTQTGDDNLRHIFEDSGARLVFTNAEQQERLESLQLPSPPQSVLLDALEGDESVLPAPDGNLLPDPTLDDIAILFYTSGTTGPPKGVPLTHGNITFQLGEIEASNLVSAGDRVLLPLPLHHVYPFVIGLLVPLALSLPVILPRSLTGPDILRAIREGNATAIIGVPRLYRALYSGIQSQVSQQGFLARSYFRLALPLCRGMKRLGFTAGKTLLKPLHRKFGPSLRLLASGGSALDPDLGRHLEVLGWQVGIGYGLTETAPLLTLNLPGSGALESVGRPLPDLELKIDPTGNPGAEDSEDRRRQVGEVLVKGPNVFKGYWNAPEKTREAFTDDGWFRTGDLGYLDERRFLYLRGRASTLIVTESGKNIQPEEVEDQYATHAYIAEIGVQEDNGRLAALIIPDAQAIRQGGMDEAEAVRSAVTEKSKTLPSYQRLSDYVISREALPRTRLGKIQRHHLADRYKRARDEKEQGRTLKSGPIDISEMSDQDRALMENPDARRVWQWFAKRYPDVRLTPDTSPYMDLNIDSIEMINLTMEVNQLTGVELGQQALARVETVRDLLLEIVHQEAGDESGLDPDRILSEPAAYLNDEQRRWLKPLGPFHAGLRRIARPLLRALFRVLFRLKVEGLENLPRDRPFVLAPNHVSILDPMVLFAIVPLPLLKQTYFAGWTGMAFKNAPLRLAARVAQTVPIDPDRAAASSLALGATVLQGGHRLIWFPEGERSRSGRLKPFKPGIGLLLHHDPVDIIPVHLEGTFEAWPRGKRLPKLHAIKVRFGEPVDPRALITRDSEEPAQAQISQGLHDRLAAMITEERG